MNPLALLFIAAGGFLVWKKVSGPQASTATQSPGGLAGLAAMLGGAQAPATGPAAAVPDLGGLLKSLGTTVNIQDSSGPAAAALAAGLPQGSKGTLTTPDGIVTVQKP